MSIARECSENPRQQSGAELRLLVGDGIFQQHGRRVRRQTEQFVRPAVRGQDQAQDLVEAQAQEHLARRLARDLARVLTPRAAELLALMPVKAAADLSKFLLSPMPGLLVEVAVAPGQSVVAGEKLAVIEAMKMENTLFASQDGVVEDVMAKKGDNLAVDQVILRFA